MRTLSTLSTHYRRCNGNFDYIENTLQEMLWELFHLSRPAAVQDGRGGHGGGGAEGPDQLLRLRGLGGVPALLRCRPEPGSGPHLHTSD